MPCFASLHRTGQASRKPYNDLLADSQARHNPQRASLQHSQATNGLLPATRLALSTQPSKQRWAAASRLNGIAVQQHKVAGACLAGLPWLVMSAEWVRKG